MQYSAFYRIWKISNLLQILAGPGTANRPAFGKNIASVANSLAQDVIPKAACFWIFGEGRRASRLCVSVCSWVPMGGTRAGGPVSTRPGRPCSLLLRCKVPFQRDIGINHSFLTHWTAPSFLTFKLSNLGLFDGTKFVVPVFS